MDATILMGVIGGIIAITSGAIGIHRALVGPIKECVDRLGASVRELSKEITSLKIEMVTKDDCRERRREIYKELRDDKED